MDGSRSTRHARGRTSHWLGLWLTIAVVAASWSTAAADNLTVTLISPDVKVAQPLNSTFDLKIQTDTGAECTVSLSTPFRSTINLPKQTADKDGYIVWTVETGGMSGPRNAWVMCNLNGKKGSLAFAYNQ